MTERKNKEIEIFIENTNTIIKELKELKKKEKNKISKRILRSQIQIEWQKFAALHMNAREQGIIKEEKVEKQDKKVIKTFKLFQDTVKIFKTL